LTEMLPIVTREFCRKRLELIFPPGAFASHLMGQLAGAAVAGMIWAGCVMPEGEDAIRPGLPYARPTTALWMNDALVAVADEAKRAAWLKASISGRAKATALEESWGVAGTSWYRDNTRESIRDEILAAWETLGPVLANPAVLTNSSSPRWILQRDFALLFDPQLTGSELDAAILAWVEKFMSRSGRARANVARARAQAKVRVTVSIPGHENRELKPGESSLLIKGAIETWAPSRLADPAILAISESADKMNFSDGKMLESIGLSIDVTKLLPDLLMVDVGPDPIEFWVIEAVASGGAVDERRKEKLIKWALSQGLEARQIRFLSVFLSRNHPAARDHVPTLAAGTHAWFMDEPESELSWANIESTIPENVVQLR
jgi:hypothetical protein